MCGRVQTGRRRIRTRHLKKGIRDLEHLLSRETAENKTLGQGLKIPARRNNVALAIVARSQGRLTDSTMAK
jgi:hypothetical protein